MREDSMREDSMKEDFMNENAMKREWIRNRKPLRVIQTNLQIRDTPRMNPEKLAQDIVALGGDALVMNVGGIYAWYPTRVEGHTENPFLPQGHDLLAEIIAACHQNGLLLFARFDFSKADDSVFLRHPDWFVRDAANKHRLIGAERPGEWSLLALTCLNAPYRNEAVAIPVLREVMNRYPIDAVFLNAPHFEPCHCVRCRKLYREQFGADLPEWDADFPKAWGDGCFRTNIRMLHDAMQEGDPSLPLILYYGNQPAFSAEVADMLCTESQDILSRGHGRIPRIHEPVVNTKLGSSVESDMPPFGIIHSSPGMEWRHTGLPDAEYRFWMSQVPAHGGQLWHSLTGFPGTITDKRVLRAVADVNADAGKVRELMQRMRPDSDVLLLWDGGPDAQGWAGLLTAVREQFDVLTPDQVTPQKLEKYAVVIVPDTDPKRTFEATASESLSGLLRNYVEQGGRLLLEQAAFAGNADWKTLAGIDPEAPSSEMLRAAYVRLETGAAACGLDPAENPLLPLCGIVRYAMPTDGSASVMATYVPPFSPVESVGAPPERASLPVEHTDWPMLFLRDMAKGQVATLLFGLGRLFSEFGLVDHEALAAGLITHLRGAAPGVRTDAIPGLLMALWREVGSEPASEPTSDEATADTYTRLIHLLNGVGERPLRQTIPLRDLNITIRLAPGERVLEAKAVLSGTRLSFEEVDGLARIQLPELSVWEAIAVAFRRE